MHELAYRQVGCFLTLTYNDANLPWDWSVQKHHVQNFMKALRKRLPPKSLSYLAVGEYGGKYLRPHYHICLMGTDIARWPGAKTRPSKTQKGFPIVTHPVIESIWSYGFHSVGTLDVKTAAYTASYTQKKLERAEEGYLDRSYDGLEWRVAPEFHLHSRNPGLGINWLKRWRSDVYGTQAKPKSHVLWRGNKVAPPIAYDRWLRENDEKHWTAVRQFRIANAETLDTQDENRVFKAREAIQRGREALYPRFHGDPGVREDL